MDSNKDIFQYVLIGIFLALFVGGVIVFATIRAKDAGEEDANQAPVVMWGTFSEDTMNAVLDAAGVKKYTTYRQVAYDSFYNQLLEAIAVGSAPDVIMVDQATLLRLSGKVIPIPFTSYPEQAFLQNFVEGTEVFLNGAVLALPFSLNPMVMFWNRDTFTNAGLVAPPAYWDEMVALTERFNDIDDNKNIRRSAIAFGEVRNVNNFKYILSTLFLQSGVPIVRWGREGPEPVLRVPPSREDAEEPAVAALRFFTDFSNPARAVYSWNRSLPEARSMFVAGDLAVYFGFLNEYQTIARLNPNLNFDVALMPQVRGTPRRTTFAAVYGFALPKAGRNTAGGFQVMRALAAPAAQAKLSEIAKLPPVRRDMLATQPTTKYWSVAYDSAIIAKTWIDPDYSLTYKTFARMVESVRSGAETLSGAISQAEAELESYVR